MSHVHLAVLTVETEIVGETALRPVMTPMSTMPAVPDTVTLLDRMAGLATPRALDQVSIARKGGKRTSSVLHGPNFAGRETGGSCGEVPLNTAV